MDVDAIWLELRRVACATNPCTDAKAIVMLRREHVAAAIARLKAL